jgi:proteic killer suppression protein
VIRSFRHKGLKQLWETGRSGKVAEALRSRALRRLDTLDSAASPNGMNAPGYDFHPLKGLPQRYTVHINGPWCITFGWDGTDAVEVDLEQYH